MKLIFCPYLQYIVVPTRRSTAEAIQILVSHALGDAGSPYLVGAVSILQFALVSNRELVKYCIEIKY